MRLAEGIVLDAEKTFDRLRFSAQRREVYVTDESGNFTKEIKERTYDLKCDGQGGMISVSIPASAGEKNIDFNTVVELVNPIARTVATADYRGAYADWYLKADDIVLKKPQGNPSPAPKQTPEKK